MAGSKKENFFTKLTKSMGALNLSTLFEKKPEPVCVNLYHAAKGELAIKFKNKKDLDEFAKKFPETAAISEKNPSKNTIYIKATVDNRSGAFVSQFATGEEAEHFQKWCSASEGIFLVQNSYDATKIKFSDMKLLQPSKAYSIACTLNYPAKTPSATVAITVSNRRGRTFQAGALFIDKIVDQFTMQITRDVFPHILVATNNPLLTLNVMSQVSKSLYQWCMASYQQLVINPEVRHQMELDYQIYRNKYLHSLSQNDRKKYSQMIESRMATALRYRHDDKQSSYTNALLTHIEFDSFQKLFGTRLQHLVNEFANHDAAIINCRRLKEIISLDALEFVATDKQAPDQLLFAINLGDGYGYPEQDSNILGNFMNYLEQKGVYVTTGPAGMGTQALFIQADSYFFEPVTLQPCDTIDDSVVLTDQLIIQQASKLLGAKRTPDLTHRHESLIATITCNINTLCLDFHRDDQSVAFARDLAEGLAQELRQQQPTNSTGEAQVDQVKAVELFSELPYTGCTVIISGRNNVENFLTTWCGCPNTTVSNYLSQPTNPATSTATSTISTITTKTM